MSYAALATRVWKAPTGDGDGGGQIRVGGLAVLGDGDAADLRRGLAGDIGGKAGCLLIPLLADGAGFPHAVVVSQLVLGGLGAVRSVVICRRCQSSRWPAPRQ